MDALREPRDSQQDLVLFLGASEIEVGFDPVLFDQELRARGYESHALNIAVRNNGTFFPLYLERVAMDLEQSHQRARVLFIHFPISRFTTKAIHHYSEVTKTHDLPSSYFKASLWNRVPMSSEEKFLMLVNKWAFNEHSLMQIPLILNRPLRSSIDRQDEDVKDLALFWNESYRNEADAWDPSTRGRFYHDIDENSLVILNAKKFLQNRENLIGSILRHDICCDFRYLDLNKDYTLKVIQSLKNLARYADHVVIVNIDEYPRFRRSESSLQRRDAFLKEAAAAIGGEIWHIDTHEQMYVDLLHFSPAGAHLFSKELSKRVPDSWLPHSS